MWTMTHTVPNPSLPTNLECVSQKDHYPTMVASSIISSTILCFPKPIVIMNILKQHCSVMWLELKLSTCYMLNSWNWIGIEANQAFFLTDWYWLSQTQFLLWCRAVGVSMCLLVDLPSAIKRQRRRSNVHIRQPLTPKEEEMCTWDAQEPVRSVLAHHTRLSFRVQFVLFDTHFCNSHSIFYHLLVSATRLSETSLL